MMVNTADIMGTHTAVSELTHSFLAPGPGEWRLLPVFSSRRNFRLRRAALENQSQGLLGGVSRQDQTPESELVAGIVGCVLAAPGTAESLCALGGVYGSQVALIARS